MCAVLHYVTLESIVAIILEFEWSVEALPLTIPLLFPVYNKIISNIYSLYI